VKDASNNRSAATAYWSRSMSDNGRPAHAEWRESNQTTPDFSGNNAICRLLRLFCQKNKGENEVSLYAIPKGTKRKISQNSKNNAFMFDFPFTVDTDRRKNRFTFELVSE
jgi:hypothetical protein